MVISGLGRCASGCRCERMERTKVGGADGHRRGEVSTVDERREGSLMRRVFVPSQRGLGLVEDGGLGASRSPRGPHMFTRGH